MDINYFKSIRSLQNKIKASNSCNQERCQKMKNRLDQHLTEHHSSTRQSNTLDSGTQEDKTTKKFVSRETQDEQASLLVPAYFVLRDETAISQIESSIECETKAGQKLCVSFTNLVQSESIADDLISSLYRFEAVEDTSKVNHNVDVDSAQMNKLEKQIVPGFNEFFKDNEKKTKSHSNCEYYKSIEHEIKDNDKMLLLKSRIYKESVQEEVYKWLQGMPICPNLKDEIKSQKKEEINTLIYEIHSLFGENYYENYEDRLKFEISKCLDNLPIWPLDSEHNQTCHKEKYNIELLNQIKNINKNINMLVSLYNSGNDNESLTTRKRKNIFENEINNWLEKIELENDSVRGILPPEQVVDLVLKRLSPLLDEPNNSIMYKLIIKGEIVELLLDLPIYLSYPKNKMIHINKLAEDLANCLISISGQFTNPRPHTHNMIQRTILPETTNKILEFKPNREEKTKFTKVIANILTTNDIHSNLELEEDIVNNIIDNIQFNDHNDIEEVIYKILYNNAHITDLQAAELAKIILIEIKDMIKKEFSNQPSMMYIPPQLSRVIPIYNTEKKFKMFTSTPKKKKKPDAEIPKLNPEQLSFLEKLSAVVRDWMKILPVHFDDTNDAIFKDTIISDLAGNLMEAIKYDQIVLGLNKSDKRFKIKDKESSLKNIIFLWLNRYGIFDDEQKCVKEIEDLYNKVNKIPIPVLTRPQHGTRQTIAKTAWLEGENYYENKEYIPKGIDILEDNISMWMNKQSDIFTHEDPTIRGKMVKALAQDMQERLVSKHSDKEIINDIGRWLNEVLKPEKKEDIPDLIEELKNRMKNIPQDVTLDRKYMEKLYDFNPNLSEQNLESHQSLTFDENVLDPNGTMKEFLVKFIQKNYDVEDPIARKVLSYTLKKELIKLRPEDRKNIYNNFGENRNNQIFSSEKFGDELEYIKILSDWLNTLPVDPNYKVLRNQHRIEFIHNLAKYFIEIEGERAKFPNAMNYDAYLMGIIASNTVYLPLPKEQKVFMLQMASSLLKKLEDYTKSAPKRYPKPAINTEDLGNLIEGFIQEHGQDIVEDPLKLEVWMDRLTEEVQNIARETADPMLLSKTQIYSKLAQIPIPGEDTVALFGLELEYATEITDWLKNLPLKNIFNKSEEHSLVIMISELVDRMINRRIKKSNDPNDTQADTDIVEFIKKWIFELPLDTRDDIVVPVVIQQLMNRIDRVSKSQETETGTDINQTNKKSDQITKKNDKPKSLNKCRMCIQDPENAIIEAVEKFCNALPIRAKNEDLVKATKDEMAKKLLLKISKLNVDPIIFNDELLFKEMFRDEVDIVLENITQDVTLQKNNVKLKKSLIDSIVELESVIKEQSAGENYKQKLENTIEASIPNPVQINQIYDPGFEFYKNRLATMFIIENFDHPDEDVKIKYEKRIQSEVDKYFEHAQNKNALPLSKDQIQNELYSALFKVPIPNEASIAGEVEEAKTRFEIDAWYELLPIKTTNNLDELLERDKILSTLAKRIHEIERFEKNIDTSTHKEIMKWLSKLPLLPGSDKNIDELANQLQNRLKATSKDRRCILKESHHEKSKGKGKKKRNSDKILGKTDLLIHDANRQLLSNEKLWPSNRIPVVPIKSAADLILEAVETWCSQLPLPTNNPKEAAYFKIIKDNLAINIIIKISEINNDPEIFADEYEYDANLDQEIERLTYNLPLLCDFQSREARKLKLKEIIRSIKPLIMHEREKHEYKEHLKHTVCSFLEEADKSDGTKTVKPSKDAVEKIVDDFIEYNYSKDNIEERNIHRNKVHVTVVKHLSDIKEKVHKETAADPLIIRNELICEMSKVPPPDEIALKDLVEEIRMKNEVDIFFLELGFPKGDESKMFLRNEMKTKLANKLFDLERNDHDNDSDSNMKKEINKCLTKLNKKVSPEVIDEFVKKLRRTELIRKANPALQISKVSFPKDTHTPSPTTLLPPTRHSIANAHAVPSPKTGVPFQPSSCSLHHDPRRIIKQNGLTSGLRVMPIPQTVRTKITSVHTLDPNIQGLGTAPVTNSSMSQNVPVAARIPIPVGIVHTGREQSPLSREVVIPQQIKSPVLTVVQNPSSNNTVPQPPVRLAQTPPPDAPAQDNIRGGSSAPITAPNTNTHLTRPTADPNARDAKPTQVHQSRVPSRRRTDPESKQSDDRHGRCKCNTSRVRKRKLVCMRGRDFLDDFDYCIPYPFMWCGMRQPFLFFD